MNKRWVFIQSKDGNKCVFDYDTLESFQEVQRYDQGVLVKEVILIFRGGRLLALGGTFQDFMKQLGIEEPKDGPVLEAV